MKSEIYNYEQSCYNDDEFAFARKPKDKHHRIDVTFYTKARSQAEAIRKFVVIPPLNNYPVNWVRERISEGCGKLSHYLTDDAVYCFVTVSELYIGKFLETKWYPNPNWDYDLRLYKSTLREKETERVIEQKRAADIERVTRSLAVASPVITCPHCQNKVDLAITLGAAIKIGNLAKSTI